MRSSLGRLRPCVPISHNFHHVFTADVLGRPRQSPHTFCAYLEPPVDRKDGDDGLAGERPHAYLDGHPGHVDRAVMLHHKLEYIRVRDRETCKFFQVIPDSCVKRLLIVRYYRNDARDSGDFSHFVLPLIRDIPFFQ